MNKLNRLGNCEVCRINPAKYTCPACNLTTCSLVCVKKHKVDKDCDGIRPRTSFSTLPKLTNFDIHQDYKLLEEVSRTIQVSHQEARKTSNKSYTFIPNRLYKLRTNLLLRGTRLLFLPANFVRHKKNKSHVHGEAIINWSVQLTFLNAEKLSIFEERWPDNIPLKLLIEKYIEASHCDIAPSAFQRLRCYREAGIDLLHVLLKADKVVGSDKTFYRMDLNITLGENLIGKTIVEFPQLFIVIQDFYRANPVSAKSRTKFRINRKVKSKNLLLPAETTKFLNESESEDSQNEIDLQKEQVCLPLRTTYKDLISISK